MQNRSDAQLLNEFARKGDEAAFRELVLRHADLIYSAALRQVSAPDLAGDVTQSVFADLARKALPLSGELPENASILGWLYRSTRYPALNQLREERRRKQREKEAMEQMAECSDCQRDWSALSPVLDEVMDELNEPDREAILLRFFKNLSFQQVGSALGVSDDTAQKRVSRSLEKLRNHLQRRGVTMSGIALGTALSANAVQAAPIALTTTLATATAALSTTLS
ncbi:MAG: RNA polymerase sigma factor, partial [Limisphaerales bacterium]